MEKSFFSAKTNYYFAAANGFKGFRSYFDNIFPSESFERIFVLKGGPGTGKSSIMKRILSEFPDLDHDAIFCSSDKSSLDGIILKNEGKRVAVIDGTAPHERDAKIPGAIDEIINLGECWNRNILSERREEILCFNKEKSKHYAEGYKLLSIAGAASDRKHELIKTTLDNQKIQALYNSIFSQKNVLDKSRKPKSFLLSCFGKDGYQKLQPNITAANSYFLTENSGIENQILNILRDAAISAFDNVIVYPSPYSEDLTEGLYIKETDTFIYVINDEKNALNSKDFILKDEFEKLSKRIEFYNKKEQELLESAKQEFIAASENHFKLEAIYTSAMDFLKINKLREYMIKEIKNIF